MQMNIKLTAPAVLALAGLVAGAWYWHSTQPPAPPNDDKSIPFPEKPEVIETGGGRLLVATVRAVERFTKKDPKDILGVPLGTTESQVQATVTYRYHITMEKRWPVEIDGKTAIVRAPKIEATLPAAFDTATVRKYTANGWARFNKDENLETLERTITGQIQSRAVSPQYDQIVKDASRETVRAFVSTWLLSQRKWGREPEFRIVVLFPGESLAARGDKSESLQ